MIIGVALGSISGIVVPLITVFIVGTILDPLVKMLVRWGLSQTLAAVITLLIACGVGAGIFFVIAIGFVRQLPEISKQLVAGWTYVVDWVSSLEVSTSLMEQVRSTVYEFVPQAGLGLLGMLSSTVYGAVSLIVGVFFALFFLFFVLRDGQFFPSWFSSLTHQSPAVVEQVYGDVRVSLRGYFRGIALTALITGPIFIIPLLLLRVPLVIPIIIVYFVLSLCRLSALGSRECSPSYWLLALVGPLPRSLWR